MNPKTFGEAVKTSVSKNNNLSKDFTLPDNQIRSRSPLGSSHSESCFLFSLQSRELVATKIRHVEPSRSWTERLPFWKETTKDGRKPSRDAPTRPYDLDTRSLEFKMVAGVHQDRGLGIPSRSMENHGDVEMAKEGRGLTTSIEL